PRSEFTFLTVCTLDKPIIWKDKPVQFVCLLSVKKNSMEDLQDMYDGLGKITENASIVQRLIKAKTHDDFMKIVNEIRRSNERKNGLFYWRRYRRNKGSYRNCKSKR